MHACTLHSTCNNALASRKLDKATRHPRLPRSKTLRSTALSTTRLLHVSVYVTHIVSVCCRRGFLGIGRHREEVETPRKQTVRHRQCRGRPFMPCPVGQRTSYMSFLRLHPIDSLGGTPGSTGRSSSRESSELDTVPPPETECARGCTGELGSLFTRQCLLPPSPVRG